MTQQAQPETQSAEAPATLASEFWFLPSLSSCQLALPALVAAEQDLWRTIVAPKGALDSGIRIQLAHAAIRAQAVPPSSPFGQVGVKPALDPALETFATKLSSCPESLSRR